MLIFYQKKSKSACFYELSAQICYNKFMPKSQFFVLVIYTLIQSQLLVWFLKAGSVFFVVIMAFMLASNILRAYKVEQFARKKGLI
jgi:hypothetical protein